MEQTPKVFCSKNIMNEVFGFIERKRTLKIIQYSKFYQNIIGISLETYILYSDIKVNVRLRDNYEQYYYYYKDKYPQIPSQNILKELVLYTQDNFIDNIISLDADSTSPLIPELFTKTNFKFLLNHNKKLNIYHPFANHKNIQKLTFTNCKSSNEIEQDSKKAFCYSDNKNITHLTLASLKDEDDYQGYLSIFKLLKQCKLTYLVIYGCYFPEEYDLLQSKVLYNQINLRSLSLSYMNLDSSHVEEITKLINELPHADDIDLSHNKFTMQEILTMLSSKQQIMKKLKISLKRHDTTGCRFEFPLLTELSLTNANNEPLELICPELKSLKMQYCIIDSNFIENLLCHNAILEHISYIHFKVFPSVLSKSDYIFRLFELPSLNSINITCFELLKQINFNMKGTIKKLKGLEISIDSFQVLSEFLDLNTSFERLSIELADYKDYVSIKHFEKYHLKELIDFCFKAYELPSESILGLLNQSNKLIHLCLCKFQFFPSLITRIVNVLKHNPFICRIEFFSFNKNRLSLDFMYPFFEELPKSCQFLDMLTLTSCFMNDSEVSVLVSALQPLRFLKNLDISENSITTECTDDLLLLSNQLDVLSIYYSDLASNTPDRLIQAYGKRLIF